MDVDVVRGLEERGVEDLLLDGGVNLQRVADLLREFLLAFIVARLLELREPFLDLAVIRLEKRDCIVRLLGPCHDPPPMCEAPYLASVKANPMLKSGGLT